MHGYSDRVNTRLVDQAATLGELLHSDTMYPAGSLVLEAGCGVGAQAVTPAANSPGARFVSVDLSETSLAEARERVRQADICSVEFQQADIFRLPFPPDHFDHVFVCFVLEHLADPAGALARLRSVLKPGGTITVIEGDHGSAYFHPDSAAARRAIACLVELQRRAGGDEARGPAVPSAPAIGRGGCSTRAPSGMLGRHFSSEAEIVKKKVRGPIKRGTRGRQNIRERYASEYSTWTMLRQRCLNRRNRDYKRYGGRGIRIAKRWDSFEAFMEDMGPRPRGYVLVRRHPDANFTPSTCSWQPPAVRQQRRSNNRLTEKDAERIRAKYKAGTRSADLARQHRVSLSHIYYILAETRWKPTRGRR